VPIFAARIGLLVARLVAYLIGTQVGKRDTFQAFVQCKAMVAMQRATTYLTYPSSHISRDILRKIIPRYGKADSLYSRQASREIPETTSLEVP